MEGFAGLEVGNAEARHAIGPVGEELEQFFLQRHHRQQARGFGIRLLLACRETGGRTCAKQ